MHFRTPFGRAGFARLMRGLLRAALPVAFAAALPVGVSGPVSSRDRPDGVKDDHRLLLAGSQAVTGLLSLSIGYGGAGSASCSVNSSILSQATFTPSATSGSGPRCAQTGSETFANTDVFQFDIEAGSSITRPASASSNDLEVVVVNVGKGLADIEIAGSISATDNASSRPNMHAFTFFTDDTTAYTGPTRYNKARITGTLRAYGAGNALRFETETNTRSGGDIDIEGSAALRAESGSVVYVNAGGRGPIDLSVSGSAQLTAESGSAVWANARGNGSIAASVSGSAQITGGTASGARSLNNEALRLGVTSAGATLSFSMTGGEILMRNNGLSASQPATAVTLGSSGTAACVDTFTEAWDGSTVVTCPAAKAEIGSGTISGAASASASVKVRTDGNNFTRGVQMLNGVSQSLYVSGALVQVDAHSSRAIEARNSSSTSAAETFITLLGDKDTSCAGATDDECGTETYIHASGRGSSAVFVDSDFTGTSTKEIHVNIGSGVRMRAETSDLTSTYVAPSIVRLETEATPINLTLRHDAADITSLEHKDGRGVFVETGGGDVHIDLMTTGAAAKTTTFLSRSGSTSSAHVFPSIEVLSGSSADITIEISGGQISTGTAAVAGAAAVAGGLFKLLDPVLSTGDNTTNGDANWSLSVTGATLDHGVSSHADGAIYAVSEDSSISITLTDTDVKAYSQAASPTPILVLGTRSCAVRTGNDCVSELVIGGSTVFGKSGANHSAVSVSGYGGSTGASLEKFTFKGDAQVYGSVVFGPGDELVMDGNAKYGSVDYPADTDIDAGPTTERITLMDSSKAYGDLSLGEGDELLMSGSSEYHGDIELGAGPTTERITLMDSSKAFGDLLVGEGDELLMSGSSEYHGDIELLPGYKRFRLEGSARIVGGSISFTAGNDVFEAGGKLESSVDLGGGDDAFTATDGGLIGPPAPSSANPDPDPVTIALGAGNDTFTAGYGSSIGPASTTADRAVTLDLGGGDDTFEAIEGSTFGAWVFLDLGLGDDRAIFDAAYTSPADILTDGEEVITVKRDGMLEFGSGLGLRFRPGTSDAETLTLQGDGHIAAGGTASGRSSEVIVDLGAGDDTLTIDLRGRGTAHYGGASDVHARGLLGRIDLGTGSNRLEVKSSYGSLIYLGGNDSSPVNGVEMETIVVGFGATLSPPVAALSSIADPDEDDYLPVSGAEAVLAYRDEQGIGDLEIQVDGVLSGALNLFGESTGASPGQTLRLKDGPSGGGRGEIDSEIILGDIDGVGGMDSPHAVDLDFSGDSSGASLYIPGAASRIDAREDFAGSLAVGAVAGRDHPDFPDSDPFTEISIAEGKSLSGLVGPVAAHEDQSLSLILFSGLGAFSGELRRAPPGTSAHASFTNDGSYGLELRVRGAASVSRGVSDSLLGADSYSIDIRSTETLGSGASARGASLSGGISVGDSPATIILDNDPGHSGPALHGGVSASAGTQTVHARGDSLVSGGLAGSPDSISLGVGADSVRIGGTAASPDSGARVEAMINLGDGDDCMFLNAHDGSDGACLASSSPLDPFGGEEAFVQSKAAGFSGASVSAGPGNDLILLWRPWRLSAALPADISLGDARGVDAACARAETAAGSGEYAAGCDRLSVSGGFAMSGDVSGGDGVHSVEIDVASFEGSVDLGDGADSLSLRVRDRSASTAGGIDLGGASDTGDADSLSISGFASVFGAVSLGGGDNSMALSGSASVSGPSVTFGPGSDSLLLQGTASISSPVTLGAAADTSADSLRVEGSATLSGDAGFGGGGDCLRIGGGSGCAPSGAPAAEAASSASLSGSVDFGAGDDSMLLNLSLASLVRSPAFPSAHIAALEDPKALASFTGPLVSAGAGDDWILLRSEAALESETSFDLGDAGDNGDALLLSGAQTVRGERILGAAGSHRVRILGASIFTGRVSLGEGDDSLELDTSSGEEMKGPVDLGSQDTGGDDRLALGGSARVAGDALFGGGDNAMAVESSASFSGSRAEFGGGDDTLLVGSGAVNSASFSGDALLGDGGNLMALNASVAPGAGGAPGAVSFHGGGADGSFTGSRIVAGAGNDRVHLNRADPLDMQTRIDLGSSPSLTPLAGFDLLEVRGGLVVTGDGVFGAGGPQIVRVGGSAAITGAVTLGAADDSLEIDTLSRRVMEGDASLGSGSDLLALSGEARLSGDALLGAAAEREADMMEVSGNARFTGSLAQFGGGADTLSIGGASSSARFGGAADLAGTGAPDDGAADRLFMNACDPDAESGSVAACPDGVSPAPGSWSGHFPLGGSAVFTGPSIRTGAGGDLVALNTASTEAMQTSVDLGSAPCSGFAAGGGVSCPGGAPADPRNRFDTLHISGRAAVTGEMIRGAEGRQEARILGAASFTGGISFGAGDDLVEFDTTSETVAQGAVDLGDGQVEGADSLSLSGAARLAGNALFGAGDDDMSVLGDARFSGSRADLGTGDDAVRIGGAVSGADFDSEVSLGPGRDTLTLGVSCQSGRSCEGLRGSGYADSHFPAGASAAASFSSGLVDAGPGDDLVALSAGAQTDMSLSVDLGDAGDGGDFLYIARSARLTGASHRIAGGDGAHTVRVLHSAAFAGGEISLGHGPDTVLFRTNSALEMPAAVSLCSVPNSDPECAGSDESSDRLMVLGKAWLSGDARFGRGDDLMEVGEDPGAGARLSGDLAARFHGSAHLGEGDDTLLLNAERDGIRHLPFSSASQEQNPVSVFMGPLIDAGDGADFIALNTYHQLEPWDSEGCVGSSADSNLACGMPVSIDLGRSCSSNDCGNNATDRLFIDGGARVTGARITGTSGRHIVQVLGSATFMGSAISVGDNNDEVRLDTSSGDPMPAGVNLGVNDALLDDGEQYGDRLILGGKAMLTGDAVTAGDPGKPSTYGRGRHSVELSGESLFTGGTISLGNDGDLVRLDTSNEGQMTATVSLSGNDDRDGLTGSGDQERLADRLFVLNSSQLSGDASFGDGHNFLGISSGVPDPARGDGSWTPGKGRAAARLSGSASFGNGNDTVILDIMSVSALGVHAPAAGSCAWEAFSSGTQTDSQAAACNWAEFTGARIETGEGFDQVALRTMSTNPERAKLVCPSGDPDCLLKPAGAAGADGVSTGDIDLGSNISSPVDLDTLSLGYHTILAGRVSGGDGRHRVEIEHSSVFIGDRLSLGAGDDEVIINTANPIPMAGRLDLGESDPDGRDALLIGGRCVDEVVDAHDGVTIKYGSDGFDACAEIQGPEFSGEALLGGGDDRLSISGDMKFLGSADLGAGDDEVVIEGDALFADATGDGVSAGLLPSVDAARAGQGVVLRPARIIAGGAGEGRDGDLVPGDRLEFNTSRGWGGGFRGGSSETGDLAPTTGDLAARIGAEKDDAFFRLARDARVVGGAGKVTYTYRRAFAAGVLLGSESGSSSTNTFVAAGPGVNMRAYGSGSGDEIIIRSGVGAHSFGDRSLLELGPGANTARVETSFGGEIRTTGGTDSITLSGGASILRIMEACGDGQNPEGMLCGDRRTLGDAPDAGDPAVMRGSPDTDPALAHDYDQPTGDTISLARAGSGVALVSDSIRLGFGDDALSLGEGVRLGSTSSPGQLEKTGGAAEVALNGGVVYGNFTDDRLGMDPGIGTELSLGGSARGAWRGGRDGFMEFDSTDDSLLLRYGDYTFDTGLVDMGEGANAAEFNIGSRADVVALGSGDDSLRVGTGLADIPGADEDDYRAIVLTGIALLGGGSDTVRLEGALQGLVPADLQGARAIGMLGACPAPAGFERRTLAVSGGCLLRDGASGKRGEPASSKVEILGGGGLYGDIALGAADDQIIYRFTGRVLPASSRATAPIMTVGKGANRIELYESWPGIVRLSSAEGDTLVLGEGARVGWLEIQGGTHSIEDNSGLGDALSREVILRGTEEGKIQGDYSDDAGPGIRLSTGTLRPGQALSELTVRSEGEYVLRSSIDLPGQRPHRIILDRDTGGDPARPGPPLVISGGRILAGGGDDRVELGSGRYRADTVAGSIASQVGDGVANPLEASALIDLGEGNDTLSLRGLVARSSFGDRADPGSSVRILVRPGPNASGSGDQGLDEIRAGLDALNMRIELDEGRTRLVVQTPESYGNFEGYSLAETSSGKSSIVEITAEGEALARLPIIGSISLNGGSDQLRVSRTIPALEESLANSGVPAPSLSMSGGELDLSIGRGFGWERDLSGSAASETVRVSQNEAAGKSTGRSWMSGSISLGRGDDILEISGAGIPVSRLHGGGEHVIDGGDGEDRLAAVLSGPGPEHVVVVSHDGTVSGTLAPVEGRRLSAEAVRGEISRTGSLGGLSRAVRTENWEQVAFEVVSQSVYVDSSGVALDSFSVTIGEGGSLLGSSGQIPELVYNHNSEIAAEAVNVYDTAKSRPVDFGTVASVRIGDSTYIDSNGAARTGVGAVKLVIGPQDERDKGRPVGREPIEVARNFPVSGDGAELLRKLVIDDRSGSLIQWQVAPLEITNYSAPQAGVACSEGAAVGAEKSCASIYVRAGGLKESASEVLSLGPSLLTALEAAGHASKLSSSGGAAGLLTQSRAGEQDTVRTSVIHTNGTVTPEVAGVGDDFGYSVSSWRLSMETDVVNYAPPGAETTLLVGLGAFYVESNVTAQAKGGAQASVNSKAYGFAVSSALHLEGGLYASGRVESASVNSGLSFTGSDLGEPSRSMGYSLEIGRELMELTGDSGYNQFRIIPSVQFSSLEVESAGRAGVSAKSETLRAGVLVENLIGSDEQPAKAFWTADIVSQSMESEAAVVSGYTVKHPELLAEVGMGGNRRLRNGIDLFGSLSFQKAVSGTADSAIFRLSAMATYEW